MSRWKTRFRKVGIWAAWSFAALSVLWIVANVWGGRALERERAEALKLGSLDLGTMLPDVAAEDNGIWELERAIAMLMQRQGLLKEASSRRMVQSTWTSETYAQARDFLRDTGEIGTLVRQAADRKAVRFNLRNQTGDALVVMQLPHLNRIQQAANYLRACARVEASEGKVPEALEDAARIARLGNSLEAEPLLISGLVDVAVKGIAFAEVDALLSKGVRVDPEGLRKLSEAFRMDPDAMRRMLLGERCFGVDCLDRMLDGRFSYPDCDGELAGTTSWVSLTSRLAFVARPWIRLDGAEYLKCLDRTIPVADDLTRPLPPAPPKWAVLAGFFFPTLEKARTSFGRAHAQSGSLRWGLAVLLHRERSGRLPVSLDEIPADLIPDKPMDPFTGKPFSYQPSAADASFSISSAGKDHDGKPLGISWKAAP